MFFFQKKFRVTQKRRGRNRPGRDSLPDILPDVRRLYRGDEFVVDMETATIAQMSKLLEQGEGGSRHISSTGMRSIISIWAVDYHDMMEKTENRIPRQLVLRQLGRKTTILCFESCDMEYKLWSCQKNMTTILPPILQSVIYQVTMSIWTSLE